MDHIRLARPIEVDYSSGRRCPVCGLEVYSIKRPGWDGYDEEFRTLDGRVHKIYDRDRCTVVDDAMDGFRMIMG